MCAQCAKLAADVWLSVDANQGYTLPRLEAALPVFVEAQVKLVEQPLRLGSEAELAGFRSPIPLAADESVQGVRDIAGLVGRFDVVNIKLDKCGGLTEALQMVSEARSAGLQVMVGNMVGTSLAMAPAFVVAQLCDYVDLDGPAFLEHDVSPGVSYEGGSIHCGLNVWGWRMNDRKQRPDQRRERLLRLKPWECDNERSKASLTQSRDRRLLPARWRCCLESRIVQAADKPRSSRKSWSRRRSALKP